MSAKIRAGLSNPANFTGGVLITMTTDFYNRVRDFISFGRNFALFHSPTIVVDGISVENAAAMQDWLYDVVHAGNPPGNYPAKSQFAKKLRVVIELENAFPTGVNMTLSGEDRGATVSLAADWISKAYIEEIPADETKP